MYEHCKLFIISAKPDVIISVPVHRLKKRQRGFNQAELVAKELGELIHVPVVINYLIRSEKTTPQKVLTRQQRKANLKKAVAIARTGVSYERGLLIDDIYTTGATIDAVSEILKENQTKIIFFLTKSVGRND